MKEGLGTEPWRQGRLAPGRGSKVPKTRKEMMEIQ